MQGKSGIWVRLVMLLLCVVRIYMTFLFDCSVMKEANPHMGLGLLGGFLPLPHVVDSKVDHLHLFLFLNIQNTFLYKNSHFYII